MLLATVLEQLVLRTRVEFWVRDSLLDFIQLLLAFAVGRANSSLRRHCEGVDVQRLDR